MLFSLRMNGGTLRIVSVVGARPQFVKLFPLDRAVRESGHQHLIAHTGQHYDASMSDVFFQGLRIPQPDINLNVGSGSHGQQTARILEALELYLISEAPDFVVVYGDTNSTLAGALAARKLHIPVAHVEAGLRSHNRRMPEEVNRIVADHASDVLLAPTRGAVDNLTREGLAERTFLVGDIMVDACQAVLSDESQTSVSADASHPYVLATLHRAENTDDPVRLRRLITALSGLDIPVRLLAHPRLVAKAEEQDLDLQVGNILVQAPLPYLQTMAEIRGAKALVTDSGGLQKEAFLLETPCVTLRTETEWPETLINSWNVLCPEGTDLNHLVQRAAPDRLGTKPFGDGQTARRIVDLLGTWTSVGEQPSDVSTRRTGSADT